MAQERDMKPGAGREPEAEIDEWRRRIDEVDAQLVRLLNSRSACAVEIGRLKRRLGLPIYSPEREAAILERVMRENPGPLEPLAVRRVFERIVDESRRLERIAAEGETPAGEDRPEAGPPLRPSGIDSREGGNPTMRPAEDAGRRPAGALDAGRQAASDEDESRRLERIGAEGEIEPGGDAGGE